MNGESCNPLSPLKLGDFESFGSRRIEGKGANSYVHNAYALKMAGVFMISTSTLFIRTQIIPRWMAFLGYGLAGVMLLRISHLDRLGWVALAFPLWVLLISLYILIDNYRHVSETSTSANL
jgi:hypothetical protein